MKITRESHLDHGLTEAQVEWLRERIADLQVNFTMQTLEIPSELGTVPCGLHGPATGDEPVPETEVSYAKRGERPGLSRMVCRPAKRVSKLTFLGGMHQSELSLSSVLNGGECILFTAYGGPIAPREPWDESLSPADREESEAFWAKHALSQV